MSITKKFCSKKLFLLFLSLDTLAFFSLCFPWRASIWEMLFSFQKTRLKHNHTEVSPGFHQFKLSYSMKGLRINRSTDRFFKHFLFLRVCFQVHKCLAIFRFWCFIIARVIIKLCLNPWTSSEYQLTLHSAFQHGETQAANDPVTLTSCKRYHPYLHTEQIKTSLEGRK